mmetsp:Transcript_12282/g.24366  ORF Transcript_12282/g.24366 Transcript_12282/m.24366 type:complete len:205 (-) Transcript_12282:8-622(-)
MLHEDCVGPDVPEQVKVLRKQEEVHDVFGAGALDVRLEVVDALLEAIDDGLPLPRDSGSAQVPCLGLSLGGLDHADLVSVGLVHGGLLEALGGVDLVHGGLHALVGGEVGDETLHDLVAVLVHDLAQLQLDLVGDVLLALKGPVELHLGDGRPNHVEDVGADLLGGVGEAVEGIINLLGEDAVLNRDSHLDENVVLRLGLTVHV